MGSRGLLIGAVVLAILAGGVYWSNKVEEKKAAQPAADAGPKILEIPEEQIEQVEIKRKDGPETIIRKTDAGKWEITSPKPLAADEDAVRSLLSTVSSLSSDKLVEEKASDLGTFGLDAPAMNVVITKKGGESRTVLIGDDTPTGSAAYVKLENDPRIFTIASWNKSSLDKTAADLRDKRLLRFDQDKLSRIELVRKGQSVEFGKNNKNEWTIIRPSPMRADGGEIEELVRKLRDAKMDTSLSAEDDKKTAASFAGGAQAAIVRVTDAAGTQQMEVRKNKEDYFARSSVLEGTHKINADLGQAVDKDLEEFRNKKLFDFGWNEPSKVQVKDGDKTMVFEKSGDKWMSGAGEIDSTSVQNLIDKIRDLSAVKFVQQGFTAPVLEITVTSNEGKQTETVEISKAGESYIAKRANEPTLYEIEAATVEELRKAAGDVKPAQAAKDEKKK